MDDSLETLILDKLDSQKIEFMMDQMFNHGLFRLSRQGIFYRLFVIANGREMTIKEARRLGISPASYYRHKREYGENPIAALVAEETPPAEAVDDMYNPFG